MFIRRLTIENIRCIEKLDWRSPNDRHAGWHVLLGDNGSGKSSFLRALTLPLIGPKEVDAARQDWGTWLRARQEEGSIVAYITPDPKYDHYGSGGEIRETLRVFRTRTGSVTFNLSSGRTEWDAPSGWFSAAYGPFRRFSGGDKESDRLFHSNPKLGAHISVLGENVALTESLSWLQDLKFKELEHEPEGHLLSRLKHFVNQHDFLPHGIKLKEVSSRGVEFEDANGLLVEVEELSDGYRAILSMTFELIRQMVRVYPKERIFDDADQVDVPGVVMIDEVDAHLHPTWQKKVGFWFTKHFPNIQFFVTTHSPLICQAAVNGSIFRLPTPGTNEVGKMLKGSELDRLLYGDILDAYSTEAFGTADTRSPDAHAMQERLAVLNVKELKKKLTPAEAEEQERLRAAFPTSPHVVSK